MCARVRVSVGFRQIKETLTRELAGHQEVLAAEKSTLNNEIVQITAQLEQLTARESLCRQEIAVEKEVSQ